MKIKKKWGEMDRNAKKQWKMQVFFQYAILVFQIFWQKKFYRSQIGEIQQRKKEPITFVSRGVKRNCINNCPLKTVHFEFGRITTWNPSRRGTQIGNLKGKAEIALKSVPFGYSFWIPERKQSNQAQ